MTPSQANEILDNWKFNIRSYPQATINEALCSTGDLTTTLNGTPDSNEVRYGDDNGTT